MGTMSTIAVAFTIFSWLICLLSTVLPYWTFENQGKQTIHAGLWKNCTIVHGGSSDCKKITEGWVHAVQTLMIISIISTLFLSMVCGCLSLKEGSNIKIALAGTLSALLAAFLITAAAITFGQKKRHDASHFSASFSLSIIAALTSFIAVVLSAVSRRNAEKGGYSPIGP